MKHSDFKEWINKDTDNKGAYCKYCKKSFALSIMGIQAVKSHIKGGQGDCPKPISIFFKEPVIKSKQDNPEVVDTGSKGTSSSNQLTLDQSLATSNKWKVEIRWALKSVSSGYLNNPCSHMNILFREMSSDSKIDQDFSMSEDKLKYTVNYGLAPHFKGIFQEFVKSSECFVVSFVKSLNLKTQECQLDLVIQFLKKSLGKLKHVFDIPNLLVIILQMIFWNIFANLWKHWTMPN